MKNSYRCPRCGYAWEDAWDCEVEDDCPECDKRHITPYASTGEASADARGQVNAVLEREADCEWTEADESSHPARALQAQIAKGESHGVIAMYERAAARWEHRQRQRQHLRTA